MGADSKEIAEEAPFGFGERHVEADGFRIRVLEKGSGEPLVFFHTARGVRLTQAHARLAETRRVIAIEAPGFRLSPVNERTADLAELARTASGLWTAAHRASLAPKEWPIRSKR